MSFSYSHFFTSLKVVILIPPFFLIRIGFPNEKSIKKDQIASSERP